MANSDMGEQIITFSYQQEGTAQGFNQLLNGVLPQGVISGGELNKDGDVENQVQISPMHLLIGDGTVIVHVETKATISLGISPQRPYIVASFNWSQTKYNYVNFESKSLSEINNMGNPIILGRGVYTTSQTLQEDFDYTRKTWFPLSKYNDYFYDSYNSKSPSFNVTPIEGQNNIGFVVGKGKAIINGKLLEKDTESVITLTTNDTGYRRITTSVSNKRIDIAVLMNDGSVRYIMGDDNSNPKAPIYPSDGLVIAEFHYTNGNITQIYGSNIKNIYNNNYMGFSAHVGERKGANDINPHTLYI